MTFRWFRPHAAAALACWIAGSGAASADAPPDLTTIREVDRSQTYNLGATGMRGWIHTKAADDLDAVQGRTTTASRQILVTHVGRGSPADGVMQVDDVITGVNGRPFADDARQSIARAIQEAEREASHGILKLTRWRAGSTADVELRLRVMGTYSDTAPYDCPKSRRILAEAAALLAAEPLDDDVWGPVTGLALLATGDPDHLRRAAELARRLGPPDVAFTGDARGTWAMGYQGVFLCEYHLLTGDPAVVPAIRAFTTSLARGQGRYGTFGHGYCERTAEGRPNGPIPPYGPVNSASLIANLAIVLGRRCGVDHPDVDAAIERGSNFAAYYVDKGSIPYGEHVPWPFHENNGKNAMAALLFAVQPGRTDEARYFARMVTASFKNREYGHTGQGFSYLWGLPGANVGGPAAAAAFFREASWHLDLARRCDGSFTYDGAEQYGAGRTDDDTYFGRSGYYGLSPTAAYVLTYALPLRKILISGRDACEAAWLDRRSVDETITAGHFDLRRKQASIEELVAALGNWSPVVRGWAAEELASRPEAAAMLPRLVALATGSDGRVRQGACEALGHLRDPACLQTLVSLLGHEDRWLRVKAAAAIKRMGRGAVPAIPELLEAIARSAEPLDPIDWADPIQFAPGELASALFGGPLERDVKAAEPALLHPAIRAVAGNPDGMARATLRNLFENILTADDVRGLGPDILDAVKVRCPADTMFGNEIRMGGFKALAKHHFVEGIEAGVSFARTQGGHGSESRTREIMETLSTYGSAAREAVPALEKLVVFFDEEVAAGGFPAELNPLRTDAVRAAIRAITESTEQPELRSFTRASAAGGSDRS